MKSKLFLVVKGCLGNCRPRGKLPPVKVCFRVSVKIRAGGQFSSGAVILEPFQEMKRIAGSIKIKGYSYNCINF